MVIRKMTGKDYGELYALWRSLPNMGLNDLDDSENGILKYLARNPATCFTAENDGRLIGAILCGHDGRRGYIHHTAVAEDFQKKGIGSALVNAALTALKNEGINKAALVVFANNKNGNGFWEKQGFSERGDLTYRNKALTKIIRMDT